MLTVRRLCKGTLILALSALPASGAEQASPECHCRSWLELFRSWLERRGAKP